VSGTDDAEKPRLVGFGGIQQNGVQKRNQSIDSNLAAVWAEPPPAAVTIFDLPRLRNEPARLMKF
jgi:hypothetical protein